MVVEEKVSQPFKFDKPYLKRTLWIGLAFFGILLVWQLYNSYCSPMLPFLFARHDYAAAVAKVGEGAYIVGESVIGYYRLCPTHDAIVHVGTTKRVRRRLPDAIRLEKRPCGERLHLMDGIPAQTIGQAIRTARATVEPSRLREAIDAALGRQLILQDEAEALRKELDE